VVLENTHNLAGGTTYTPEQTRACVEACARAKLKLHIDGARLWNAAVALGVAPRALAAGADTLMVTLSKGLCARPARCCCVAAARRQGAPRAQAARRRDAAGRHPGGGRNRRARDDDPAPRSRITTTRGCWRRRWGSAAARAWRRGHQHRRRDARRPRRAHVVDSLRAKGVLATAMDARTLRLTTHRDVSRADCERAAGFLEQAIG
jgi:threonine aldolase